MPYESERANPYGYEPLATDEFLQERLRTFAFTAPKTTPDAPSPVDFLSHKRLDELPTTVAVQDLTYALAVDGSLAQVPEERGFELAAVKVGVVLQHLGVRRDLMANPQKISPEAIAKLYKTGSFTSLLPGEGVFKQNSAEDTWQDKFREELHENLKHMRLPFAAAHQSLLEVLKTLAPSAVKTRCLACADAGRVSKAENSISLAKPGAFCPLCYRDFYFSDFLFTEAWTREGKASDVFLAMMLIFERLLFHGMMVDALTGASKLDPAKTVFVLDGPLAVYSTASLNAYFLDALHSLPAQPLAMGVEKTGTFARFARTEAVQEALQPGTVAMVTSEVANVLAGRPPTVGSSRAYTYGKRFLYRTRDGFKTFVFMALPKTGSPSRDFAGGEAADEWATYPTVRSLCEFLEENQTDKFGVRTAALDVVAQANYEASLPKVLSAKFLDEMLPQL